jgi:hypothetical protein
MGHGRCVILFLFKFQKLADNIKESCEKSIEITDFDGSLVEAMIYFMYNSDYDIPNGSSSMIFNAKMYQIADKYGISTLKRYARGKFSISIEEGWKDIDFPNAVGLAYNTTPPSDRGLRDAVVVTSLERFDALMERDDFNTELVSNADFAVDIIRFQRERFRSIRCYTCKACSRAFDIGKPIDKSWDGTVSAYQLPATACPVCERRDSLGMPRDVVYSNSP